MRLVFFRYVAWAVNPTIVRRHLDVHTLEVAADGFAKVLEINTIKLFAVLDATLGKLRLGVIITLKISLIIFAPMAHAVTIDWQGDRHMPEKLINYTYYTYNGDNYDFIHYFRHLQIFTVLGSSVRVLLTFVKWFSFKFVKCHKDCT